MNELGNTPADKNYQPSGISKAKEKANEYAEKVMLSVNHRLDVRDAYWDGYEQAEKDLALTWEDVKQIVEIADKMMPDTAWDEPAFEAEFPTEEKFYEEVLKRYNDTKK